MYITNCFTVHGNVERPVQLDFAALQTAIANNTQIRAEIPLARKHIFYKTQQLERIPAQLHISTATACTEFSRIFKQSIEQWIAQPMETYYTQFSIPKRSGGMRPIDAPQEDLKEFMRLIKNFLEQQNIYANNVAYAYVPGRTAADAVKRHASKNHKWFLKLDLHNFFGSCTPEFIKQQLQQIPFFSLLPTAELDNFIKLCCLHNGLPQGTPLSPWLTNQIMLPLDYKISKHCREHAITYTRYADDMIFSCDAKEAFPALIQYVTETLQPTPLTINTTKTKVSSNCGQNYILGLMLNKDSKVTVGHKRKEICKATIHNLLLHPEEWDYNRATEFLGKLSYYLSIEPEYFNRLLNSYEADVKQTLVRIIKAV